MTPNSSSPLKASVYDTCVLVHSCNARRPCWAPFQYFWRKHSRIDPLVFISSEGGDASNGEDFIDIRTGNGEWSDRLMYALAKLGGLGFRKIFMMNEDFWLTEEVTKEWWNMVDGCSSDAHHYGKLHHFYKFIAGTNKMDPKSKYLTSTEPTAWNIGFLAGLLIPNENVWRFEIDGTRRLRDRPIPPNILFTEWCGFVNAMSSKLKGTFRPEPILRDEALGMMDEFKRAQQ